MQCLNSVSLLISTSYLPSPQLIFSILSIQIEIFYLHGDSLFKAGFGNIIEAGPELLVDGNLFFSNRVGNQGRAKDKHALRQLTAASLSRNRARSPGIETSLNHALSMLQGILRGRKLLRMVILSGPVPGGQVDLNIIVLIDKKAKRGNLQSNLSLGYGVIRMPVNQDQVIGRRADPLEIIDLIITGKFKTKLFTAR